MIALDRLVDQAIAAGLDPKKPEDKEQIRQFVEHAIAHELGHLLQLDHVEDDKINLMFETNNFFHLSGLHARKECSYAESD